MWSSTKECVEGQVAGEGRSCYGQTLNGHEKIKRKQTIVNGNLLGKQCPKDPFGDTFCHLKN